MNDLLTLNEDDLLERLLTIIKEANPRLKIGERMSAPVCTVWKGKLVELMNVPREIISLDFQVPHVEPPKRCIEAKKVKITFKELQGGMEMSSLGSKWLYPYNVDIPHRKWLVDHKPGDTVLVLDDAFDASPLTLTEQHFIDHEYVLFRFGISD